MFGGSSQPFCLGRDDDDDDDDDDSPRGDKLWWLLLLPLLEGRGGGDFPILLPMSWKCRNGTVLPLRTGRGGDKRVMPELLTSGLLCTGVRLPIPLPVLIARFRGLEENGDRETLFAGTIPILLFSVTLAPEGWTIAAWREPGYFTADEYDWLPGGPRRLLTADKASMGLGRKGAVELIERLEAPIGTIPLCIGV